MNPVTPDIISEIISQIASNPALMTFLLMLIIAMHLVSSLREFSKAEFWAF
jgi:low affinity Fe/Cu permease